jgi:hypothetical protein
MRLAGRGSRRGSASLLAGTVSEERALCGGDLQVGWEGGRLSAFANPAKRVRLLCWEPQAILGGVLPRAYGEAPREPGGFTTCLAPSPFHDRLLKLRRPLP